MEENYKGEPKVVKFGDLHDYYDGSLISVDSTSLTFYVKLDEYKAEISITKEEADCLSSVIGRLKKIKELPHA